MIPVPAIRGIRYNLKLDVKPSRYITARLRMWYVIFLLPCICDTVHHWELCLNSDCIQWIALRSMWWWCDDTNSASRRVVEMKSKCYPTSHVVQCPRKIFMQLSSSDSFRQCCLLILILFNKNYCYIRLSPAVSILQEPWSWICPLWKAPKIATAIVELCAR